MRIFTRMLCVVMALMLAVSVCSCSLTKQYSYKTDDVELPIGVYIYFLDAAYGEARTLAQKSDLYDAEKGTYDGSTSFLKMEITDDDGNTAIAEDWIRDKADEYMMEALAVYHEYNRLGATVDEAAISQSAESYKTYWEKGYPNYGYGPLSESLEPYGISYDSAFLVDIRLSSMKDAVFTAEYGVDGAEAVSDAELNKYFEENYTSYHYFSAPLYNTVITPTTDENGNETNSESTKPMTKDEIATVTATFDGYAKDINGGTSFSDVLSKYNAGKAEAVNPVESITKIDPETEDEIQKAILGLKEGEAKQVIIGDNEETRLIYLIYKEPIAKTTESYFAEEGKRDTVLSEMKQDDFKALLKKVADSLSIDKSSACKDYKPSMFES